jgi:hypothetical protein
MIKPVWNFNYILNCKYGNNLYELDVLIEEYILCTVSIWRAHSMVVHKIKKTEILIVTTMLDWRLCP